MSLQVFDRGQESHRIVIEHAEARIALPAKGIAWGTRDMAVINRQASRETAYRARGSEIGVCKSVPALLIEGAVTRLAVRVPAGNSDRELIVGLEGVASRASSTLLATRGAHPAAHARLPRVEVGDTATGADPFSPLGFPDALLAVGVSPASTGVVKLIQRLRLLAQRALPKSVHRSKYNLVINLHLGGG